MNAMLKNLRDVRKDNDKSQKEIGAVLGISQAYYSQYENGNNEMPLRHLITLADYYNVSADYLLGRTRYREGQSFDHIYVTRDCSCETLVKNVLSLSEAGRQAVVDYIELQNMKEKTNKK